MRLPRSFSFGKRLLAGLGVVALIVAVLRRAWYWRNHRRLLERRLPGLDPPRAHRCGAFLARGALAAA